MQSLYQSQPANSPSKLKSSDEASCRGLPCYKQYRRREARRKEGDRLAFYQRSVVMDREERGLNGASYPPQLRARFRWQARPLIITLSPSGLTHTPEAIAQEAEPAVRALPRRQRTHTRYTQSARELTTVDKIGGWRDCATFTPRGSVPGRQAATLRAAVVLLAMELDSCSAVVDRWCCTHFRRKSLTMIISW